MSSTVLGATGFIGARLVAYLRAHGEEVFAPPRGSPEIFSRPLGRLYYCIGMTADYGRNPAATFEAHSAYLVRLIAEASFDRIVYLSSTRLYDGLEDGDEDAALPVSVNNPRHLYDLTKALGEHFTLLHTANRGMVARLSSVYDNASDATGFLPDLFRQLAAEKAFSLDSTPNASRDYIHIDDVLAALVALMTQGQAGSIYNVGSGENVSNAEMVDLINRRGWHVVLTRPVTPMAPSPRIHIDRLRTLGVEPRSTLDYLKNQLDGIAK
ncbi:NAD-dependent epimerase/dehydratase family protein [Denitratisoma oestradiolicum]|uniref:NAD-dependent epimerase/dehydratase domain-containing protein n=1 Tax=Denitratisoma oestradiolicum TaxID=311182 RepID=A0A6S6XWU2_9PROT|nr:SDR family oxidoreductase [Denitratisoma oestradiolicum]TWO78848.1 hypothetical protein CBW56_17840 [Denitratisoma oestradiolicum]CAB1370499.1 conserved protein of unknown function [Denitratisoma oestradiolicum]